jgi:serine/threonine-protein kinase
VIPAAALVILECRLGPGFSIWPASLSFAERRILMVVATAVFCVNCNQLYPAEKAGVDCPGCGQTLEPMPDTELLETQLVRADQAPRQPAELSDVGADDPLNQLRDRLHVYELQVLLGSGGMGRVYLAKHLQLMRRCALKILSPKTLLHHVDYIAQFRDEGRATAELVHPNIVTTHAIGESAGLHFLEMEYVAGGSLRQVLREEERLLPLRAVTIATRLADALAFAHRRGIVHRDIKPENVVLTLSGVPKVTDFGLAKRIRAENDVFGPRCLIGTPAYLAPELYRGEDLTPAADVYALGVTLFVMLAGRPPYRAKTLRDLQHAVLNDPIPDIRKLVPEVPLEIAEGMYRLLEKAPENRPATGREAFHLLSAVAGGSRDVETLLRLAFGEARHVQWNRTGSRYLIEVWLAEGRRQRVFLEPNSVAAGEHLLTIYSPCCPVETGFCIEALRLNAEIAHGALAIRSFEGQDMFCMLDNYPRATADPEEIRRSVLEVAHRADAVERLLTGLDLH